MILLILLIFLAVVFSKMLANMFVPLCVCIMAVGMLVLFREYMAYVLVLFALTVLFVVLAKWGDVIDKRLDKSADKLDKFNKKLDEKGTSKK